jgi:hypothetical protein
VKNRPIRSTFSIFATHFDLAHKCLDDAAFAAYGWQPDLTDEEILEKLLGSIWRGVKRTSTSEKPIVTPFIFRWRLIFGSEASILFVV